MGLQIMDGSIIVGRTARTSFVAFRMVELQPRNRRGLLLKVLVRVVGVQTVRTIHSCKRIGSQSIALRGESRKGIEGVVVVRLLGWGLMEYRVLALVMQVVDLVMAPNIMARRHILLRRDAPGRATIHHVVKHVEII